MREWERGRGGEGKTGKGRVEEGNSNNVSPLSPLSLSHSITDC